VISTRICSSFLELRLKNDRRLNMKMKLLWTFEFIINFNYLNLFINIFTRKIYKVPTKYRYIKQYYKSIIKSIIYYKKYYIL